MEGWERYFSFEETGAGWIATCWICATSKLFRTEEEAREWAWDHYHNGHRDLRILLDIMENPRKYGLLVMEDNGEHWVTLEDLRTVIFRAFNVNLERARLDALKTRILFFVAAFEEGVEVSEIHAVFDKMYSAEEVNRVVDELLAERVFYEPDIGKVALL